MTEQLSEPLVPADVDLRGLDYMPFLGNHLFGSDFNARCSDTEWRAGVTLWWAAWNQQPAGSLPDDDLALCRLADLGRDLKLWKKIKSNALRGFVRCTDGRIYHEFLCKQVLVAWEKRVKEREKKRKWRNAKAEKGAGTQEGTEPGQQQYGTGTGTGTHGGTERLTGRDVTGRDGTVLQNQDQKPPLRVAEPIFGEWVAFLERKGVKADSARTFIGLMRKGYGDELVVEVMQEAERQDITSPKPWISKALQVRSVKREQGQQSEPSQTTKAMIALQSMKVET